MRVLLIALLAAISYAQTVEHAVATSSIQKITKFSPLIQDLVENQKMITIDGFTVHFLEPISAGIQGAVVKARINEEIMALKIMRENEEIEREVETMRYLVSKTSIVPTPKLDGRILHLLLDSRTFYIFAMEYIPYPTAASLLVSKTLDMTPSEREEYLNTEQAKEIYSACKSAMMSMWSTGVIHHDPHMKNILYNEESGEAKVIDFGFATRSDDAERFKFDVAIDFTSFLMFFIGVALHPEKVRSSETSEDPQRSPLSHEMTMSSDSMHGDLNAAAAFDHDLSRMQILDDLPDTEEWDRLFRSFVNIQQGCNACPQTSSQESFQIITSEDDHSNNSGCLAFLCAPFWRKRNRALEKSLNTELPKITLRFRLSFVQTIFSLFFLWCLWFFCKYDSLPPEFTSKLTFEEI